MCTGKLSTLWRHKCTKIEGSTFVIILYHVWVNSFGRWDHPWSCCILILLPKNGAFSLLSVYAFPTSLLDAGKTYWYSEVVLFPQKVLISAQCESCTGGFVLAFGQYLSHIRFYKYSKFGKETIWTLQSINNACFKRLNSGKKSLCVCVSVYSCVVCEHLRACAYWRYKLLNIHGVCARLGPRDKTLIFWQRGNRRWMGQWVWRWCVDIRGLMVWI